jgi:hypothetical protein
MEGVLSIWTRLRFILTSALRSYTGQEPSRELLAHSELCRGEAESCVRIKSSNMYYTIHCYEEAVPFFRVLPDIADVAVRGDQLTILYRGTACCVFYTRYSRGLDELAARARGWRKFSENRGRLGVSVSAISRWQLQERIALFTS